MVAACTVMALVLNGYRFGVGDHATKIPFLKAAADPELYPHDIGVAQRHSYVTFLRYLVLPLVSLVGWEPAYLALHVISLAALQLSLFVLARGISGRDSVAYLAMLLCLVSKPVLGGIGTADNLFIARELAYPLLFLGVHFFLQGRLRISLLLFGVGINLHPATVIPFVGMLLFAKLFTWRRGDWRECSLGTGLFLLAALPFIVARLQSESPAALSVPDPAWMGLLRLRLDHHYFPSAWTTQYTQFLPYIALGLWSIWLGPTRRVDRLVLLIVLASLLECLAGWLFTEVVPIQAVIIATPFRGTLLPMVLSLVYMARMVVVHGRRTAIQIASALGIVSAAVVSHAHLLIVPGAVLGAATLARRRGWGRLGRNVACAAAGLGATALFLKVEGYFRDLTGAWAIAQVRYVGLAVAMGLVLWTMARMGRRRVWNQLPVACLVALVALVADNVVSSHASYFRNLALPGLRRQTTWEEVQVWARRNTPRSARFITPPDLEGFRIFSERGIVGDWKDGTFIMFSKRSADQWWSIMRDLHTRDRTDRRGYTALDEDALRRLGAKYAAEYVVARKTRALAFKPLYENRDFRVYQIDRPVLSQANRPVRWAP